MKTNRAIEFIRLHRMQATGLTLAAIIMIGSSGSLSVTVPPATADAAYSGLLVSTVTAEDLQAGVEERLELLTRSLTVTFITGTGTKVSDWNLQLSDHPSLVTLSLDLSGKLRAIVNEKALGEYVASSPIDSIPTAKTCVIESEEEDMQGVLRINTSCMSENGYSYDNDLLVKSVKAALESNSPSLSVPLAAVDATIEGSQESGAVVHGTLTLLASGESNFKGSGAGRKDNVRKALNEHINNIVIPQGETFSFNSALGEKVTLRAGWKMALTIFGGSELRPAPGGGICQASTTLFRAALRAGLPILEHKSHSLYVTYYEKHGVGLDATIFMGHQDMIFKNDTLGPIVIQSRTIGDDAVVNIFGIDDGRSVDISGPYFARAGQKILTSDGHRIRGNEIGWERTVRMLGGAQTQEAFVARYKTLPYSVSKKYTATTVRTHGNAETAERKVVADNR